MKFNMFGNVSAQQADKRIYYPLLSSENLDNGGNAPEQVSAIWSRLATVSPDRKLLLLSDELPIKIKLLQESFHCSDVDTESVSVLIRWLYFDEIDIEALKESLSDIFGEQGQKVFEFIQNEILTIKPKPKTEEMMSESPKTPAVMVKLPLLQALSKYEQLGNQQITQERIVVKSQSEPVRPSLLYWIKYYRDELGIGHHDSVQRGNFLFRSENGKRLSGEERERVNLVLKSIEENFPLDIDTERSEIVFPVFEAPRPVMSQPQAVVAPRPVSNAAFNFGQGGMAGSEKPASGGSLSFTSKHVFPAEKNASPVTAPVAAPTQKPAPQVQMPTSVPAPAPKANPFRIRPVSLGKDA